MLVLLPSTSPACERRDMTVIIENYKRVIQKEVEHMENTSDQLFRKNCCQSEEFKNRYILYTCNDTMEISSLCKMQCAMQNQAKRLKNFRCMVYQVSQNSDTTLKCGCLKPSLFSQTGACGTVSQPSAKKKCFFALCQLMKTISSFSSCWKKLVHLSQNKTLLENIC
nr:interleukin-7 isoform X2 [Geotrypetes seraphini]XP_033789183.1 interleukin-7 isoform X2 [Geotrypetes seraphini]XP_033789184.1 interleukin-7 isoform X2 [Geotrypetes seraphini]XP_033789185.1 interleukin-7 isoform X2 [Geotrypetes seraphini]XP_033789186.1 interleukin-7 isoform X2 [Geotrypetes seraphini]XP_033789187.1 interleukin-7 isoform X2 [Geotrypetes seraphini]